MSEEERRRGVSGWGRRTVRVTLKVVRSLEYRFFSRDRFLNSEGF